MVEGNAKEFIPESLSSFYFVSIKSSLLWWMGHHHLCLKWMILYADISFPNVKGNLLWPWFKLLKKPTKIIKLTFTAFNFFLSAKVNSLWMKKRRQSQGSNTRIFQSFSPALSTIHCCLHPLFQHRSPLAHLASMEAQTFSFQSAITTRKPPGPLLSWLSQLSSAILNWGLAWATDHRRVQILAGHHTSWFSLTVFPKTGLIPGDIQGQARRALSTLIALSVLVHSRGLN